MVYKKFQATNSFSLSGGYAGFKASASVDVNKFEESEESKKDFGEEQLTYNIGGDSLDRNRRDADADVLEQFRRAEEKEIMQKDDAYKTWKVFKEHETSDQAIPERNARQAS